MSLTEPFHEHYKNLLVDYLGREDGQLPDQAQTFHHHLIEEQIPPEEAVAIHLRVIQELYPDLYHSLQMTFDFLQEGLLAYGPTFREHQKVLQRQRQLESDIDFAAHMQETFLRGNVPQSDFLDIGVLSRPARKMSGDYFHFVQEDTGRLSMAIADVIGKGIPAALSMSMIKYAMDSMPEQRMMPHEILASLNRVVAQNVDPEMFVTMMYGLYDPYTHHFYVAGAGHEPGFFYQAETDQFTELRAKGLALGISPTAHYRKYVYDIKREDMIILLTDGVTECRTEEGFIQT